MRTTAIVCLLCTLCVAAGAEDIIGRATVTADVAIVRARGHIVAWLKRGAVLDVLRVEGNTYWVRCAEGEGAVPSNLVRFEAVKPAAEETAVRRPGQQPGEDRRERFLLIEGNRFPRIETNRQWTWEAVTVDWSRIRRLDGRRGGEAGAAWPKGPCDLLDVLVAADGSALLLAATPLFRVAGPAGEVRPGPVCPTVFRTFDGGATFEELSRAAWPIAVAPSNPRVLYGLSGRKLFRSEDAGRTWREVCADLQLPPAATAELPEWCVQPPAAQVAAAAVADAPTDPAEGRARLAGLLQAARNVTIQVDPFDANRLCLGLRELALRPALLSTRPYGAGATGPGAPGEWRLSEDGGRTWGHRLYKGAPEVGLVAEGGPVMLPYVEKTVGNETVRIPDAGGRLLLMGGVWFGRAGRGLMYWADQAAGPADAAWYEAGRRATQPWQGVMVSTDGGATWRQVAPPRTALGLPGDPNDALASLSLARPGAYRGDAVLFGLAVAPADAQGTQRLIFCRHHRGEWQAEDLLRLKDIAMPQPRALLTDSRGERIYIPLDPAAPVGRKVFRGDRTAPEKLGGILYSPDGGDTWHLYSAAEAEGELLGPDLRGTLYCRTTAGDVRASTAPRGQAGGP